jgi:hypothetical protein
MPAVAALKPIKNNLAVRGSKAVWLCTNFDESKPRIVRKIQGRMLYTMKLLTPTISERVLSVTIVIIT